MSELSDDKPDASWELGPLISTPEPANRALLPSGIIKALPASRGGRACLEFRNETDAKVEISNAICLIRRGGRGDAPLWQGAPLLSEPIVLKKRDEPKQVDVTDLLKKALENLINNADDQTFRFRIRLDLKPEPWQQPAPGAYRAVLKNGQFERFTADSGL